MRTTAQTEKRRNRRAGLTLVELIVAFSVLLILSTMALPLTRIRVQREKERRLRLALEEMRTAIDRYKDAADSGMLSDVDPDNHGYPESLDMLVEGVESGGPGAMGMGMGMNGMNGMPGQQGGMQQRQGIGGGQSAFGGRANSGSAFGNSGGAFGSSRSGSSRSGSSGFGSSRSDSSSRSGFGSQGSAFGDDEDEDKKIRFLRKIPVDPITGNAEWGLRSVSDDPGSMSWGGSNVFDVYSLSMDLALDGTRYSEW